MWFHRAAAAAEPVSGAKGLSLPWFIYIHRNSFPSLKRSAPAPAAAAAAASAAAAAAVHESLIPWCVGKQTTTKDY